MQMCNYGCQQTSNFQFKNGKYCCCSRANQCPAIKEKNSNGLKRAYTCGKKDSKTAFTDEQRKTAAFVKSKKLLEKLNSRNNYSSNSLIKKALIKVLNKEEKCDICGISEWLSKKINVELDHIDGNSSNNELSNLRFLCPNCHAQTDTYCGKSINTGSQKVSDSELLDAIKTTQNIRQALIQVKLVPKGANYARAYKLLSQIKNN